MPSVTVRLKNDTQTLIHLQSGSSNGSCDVMPGKTIACGHHSTFTLQTLDQPLNCALSYCADHGERLLQMHFIVQEDDINTRVQVRRGDHADVETSGEYPAFSLNITVR